MIVYDTLGLFNTHDGHAVVKAEISRAVQMAGPGLHAFFILFKIGNRFTNEDKKTIERIQDIIGKDADKLCILVLNGEDNFICDEMTVEDILKTADSGLKQSLEWCQN